MRVWVLRRSFCDFVGWLAFGFGFGLGLGSVMICEENRG